MTRVITGDGIIALRKLTLWKALELESRGMHRSHGRSALTILRSDYGVQAQTTKAALAEWEQRLREEGIL